MAEFIPSTKGKPKLLHEGHMYVQKTARPTKIYWKCVKETSYNCRGTATTDGLRNNLQIHGQHSHPPFENRVRLAVARNEMKEVARDTRDKPSQIYAQVLVNIDPDTRAILPSEEACKQTIRRQRPCALVEPATLRELGDIPAQLQRTSLDGEFMFYDNGANNPNRILIFGSNEAMMRLAAAQTMYVDGTFKIAPTAFAQVYVVRVPIGDNYITACYCLLPNKRRATYEEMFRAIADRCTQLLNANNQLYIANANNMPQQIALNKTMSDFEESAMTAIATVFGMAIERKGCFYHLTQSTWRHIVELGLRNHYDTNNDFRLYCGMLDGLAFLPPLDVQAGLQQLRAIVEPRAIPLLEYFDATYVNGHAGRAPLFPPEMWNQNQATLDGDPRTNNVCEGWNNRMGNLVGQDHPPIAKLVEWFKKDEAVVSTAIIQNDNGNPPKKRVNRESQQLQTRLRSICLDLNAGRKNIAEFLRAVGFNIRLYHRH